MVLVQRLWQFRDHDVTVSPQLVAQCGDNPVLAKLLAIRGITDSGQVERFLNLDAYQPASPLDLPQMDVAVQRVVQAIDNAEPILVYGDFDVDGVTGTSILMQALRLLGAKVSYYIPDRHTEGHGLNTASLCRLVSARQVKLVITTDTGSTNFNEVSLLNGLKVDTIITDHHEIPEHLPPAIAVLTPKLVEETSPLKHLCGAGVAYLLSQALYQHYNRPVSDADALLDLVAIGTVVDMVPLLDENRYLVWRGLQVLQHRHRLGIQALLLEANINETAPITSQTIGFTLGPRLNAVGRLSKADDAVELMITDDPEQARTLAAKLEQHNRQRREMVETSVLQAEQHLNATGELSGQKAVILCSPDWGTGIVGLMATRLVEKHNRPSFVGYVDAESNEIRFSCRSIPTFDMHANLQKLDDLFIRWGGHSGAAGFSIPQDKLPQLKQRLYALCQEMITDAQMQAVTTVDMVLKPSQVNPYLIQMLDSLSPFGQSNPAPVFALTQIKIGAQRMMGDKQQHLKLVIPTEQPGQHLEAIQWNYGEGRAKLDASQPYRLAFTAELNTYNGTEKVQLLMKDVQSEAQAAQRVMHAPPVVSHVTRNVVSLPVVPHLAEAVLNPQDSPTVVDETVTGPRWLDHRHRDDLEGFLTQVLLAEQSPECLRVFCEGTQTGLAFPLVPGMLGARYALTGKPVETLVLWDLPPSADVFVQVIQDCQPQVIHVLGGKYRKIPLQHPPKVVLEGFYKVLQRLCSASEQAPIAIDTLTTTLATTAQVIWTALSVLQQAQYVMVQTLNNNQQIIVQFNPSPPDLMAELQQWVQYASFKDALQQVQQFRQWLQSAPVEQIQHQITFMLQSAVDTALSEREQRHVVAV